MTFPAFFNLTSLNGQNGFIIGGNGFKGNVASAAGDINADGIVDMVVGAPSMNYGAGQCYIIFGGKSSFSSPFNYASLDGSNGFSINGFNQYDSLGQATASILDFNSDGIDDIAVSAPGANYQAGQIYIIFGSSNGFPPEFNLSSLNGQNGFVINGINQGDYAGYSISSAGDINADGIDDIIIGNLYANGFKGQSYILFGSKSTFPSVFKLVDLNGQNGFIINGSNQGDFIGISVSFAGDINADGVSDIIIGARGIYFGQSYVILGSKNGFPSPFNLSSINGDNGFSIYGTSSANVGGGDVVSYAGDLNARQTKNEVRKNGRKQGVRD